jgi:hypothetical protein
MAKRGIVRRRGRQQATRAVKSRPRLELLEDRTLLNNGNWLVHLNGLPGDTRAVQTAAAQTLIHNTGLDRGPIPVQIVDHVGTDGILWIRTPAWAQLNWVQYELHAFLPGFDYVEDYNPGGDNPNLRSWFQQFESPGPDGSGPPPLGPGGGGGPSGPNIINPGLGFDGIDDNQSTCHCQPPDTIGAAGPGRYIETVNTALAMYDKTSGATLVGPTSFASFFAPLGGELSFSDPTVTYDEIHQRFVIAALDFDTNSQCRLDVAISKSNDPTTLGSADWDFNRYDVNDGVGGFDFADYPKLGYNADGYVFSFNMFPNLSFFDHVNTLAVRFSDRAGFLNAVPGGFNRFTLAPASMHGSAPGDPMWFVEDGHEGGPGGDATVVKETNVFSNAPNFTFTTIPELPSLGSYSAPPRAPQQGGGGVTIDTLDARFYFSALRNVGGTTHLVAAHTVGTAGVARVRWYDFDVGAATPGRIQEGEINQGAGVYTFLPGLDINAGGSIGMTFGQSAPNQHWSMYVTGRGAGDAPGTLQTPVLAAAGIVNSPDTRAGDYSFVNVDPANNTTFWAVNEYAGSGAFWKTWIQKFDVGSPAGPSVTGQTPGGTVPPAVTQVQVSFNEPVNVSGPGGFDPSKITQLVGPAPFSVSAVNPVNPANGMATTFTIVFAGAGLTAAGNYSFHVGPNITDANGNAMDQDQDGPPPGQANDYYLATLAVARPAVASASPTGTVAPAVPKVHVVFNEPVLVSSFDTSKVTAFTRNGASVLGDIASVVPTNQSGSTASEFDVNFAAGLEKATGVYSLTIGANVTDAYGNTLAAAFTTGFNIDGPRVTALTPTGGVVGPVSSETVTFNRAVQVSTLTAGEVMLTDPGNNAIPVTVTPVSPANGAATQFTLTFASQKTSGVYTTTIGPDVQDTFGNKMDQNGNFIPGESGVAPAGDQFLGTFTVLNGAIGPDGFGYAAGLAPFAPVELANDPNAFTIIQYADDLSVPVDLGGHTFNLYGHTYTGNNQLYVSSNGLISFGVADSSYVPTDMTSSPSEAAMAPLWADWIKTGGSPMVLGKIDNANHQLIVEWNQVNWYGHPGVFTFEAILQLDVSPPTNTSTFTFEYMSIGTASGFATSGIKDQGAQSLSLSSNRLVAVYPSGQGRPDLVKSGQALSFAAPPFGANLSGNVYNDLNHNGAPDSGEPGLQNWTVTLTAGSTVYTATTDANGNYAFTNVTPATYTVSEVLQSGWVESQPVPPGTSTVTLQPRQSVSGYNFGDYAVTPGTIVDDKDPGFQTTGAGWTTRNGGYRGTYASHSSTGVQSGNLLANPGFETGDFSGWTTALAPYPFSWLAVAPNPHSGNFAAQFGAFSPDVDEIYQDLPTISGHTYQVSYWVANDGGGNTEIRSSWGGTVLEDLFPDNAFPYEQHTFDVTATSTSTEFRIGGNQTNAFWYLDDVSVTDLAPPENDPGTFTVNSGAPGSYELFATWVADPANATNARYQVFDGTTLLGTVTENQQVAPTAALVGGTYWQKLGTFTTTTGTFQVVMDTNVVNGTIVADAVFTAAAPAPSTPTGLPPGGLSIVSGGNPGAPGWDPLGPGAAGVPRGGSGPGGAGAPLAGPLDPAAAAPLPALSPGLASVPSPTAAGAPGTGKPPGQEVAAGQPLASPGQGDAALALWSAKRHAPAEADPGAPDAGSTLPSVLPTPEQHGTAAALAPAAHKGGHARSHRHRRGVRHGERR